MRHHITKIFSKCYNIKQKTNKKHTHTKTNKKNSKRKLWLSYHLILYSMIKKHFNFINVFPGEKKWFNKIDGYCIQLLEIRKIIRFCLFIQIAPISLFLVVISGINLSLLISNYTWMYFNWRYVMCLPLESSILLLLSVHSS